jgi:hypothetical protein
MHETIMNIGYVVLGIIILILMAVLIITREKNEKISK